MTIKNPLSNLKLIPYLSCPINKCIINVFGNEEIKTIEDLDLYLQHTSISILHGVIFTAFIKYPFISNKSIRNKFRF